MFVTSVCESMLITEWRLAADWVPVRAERFRWLVHHRNDSASFGDDESWEGDWLNDDADNPGDTNLSSGQGPKKFGIIPKFRRIFEVSVAADHLPGRLVLKCKCEHHNRMGFPCRHIASVIKANNNLKNIYPNGFPLASVRLYWHLSYYYYGISTSPDFASVKTAIANLMKKDSLGVPCLADLPHSEPYSMSGDLSICLHSPVECRVLNYCELDAIEALVAAGDRRNRHVLTDNIPAGLSQTSFLGSQDGGFLSQFDADDSDGDGRDWSSHGVSCADRMKSKFYAMAAAVDNLSEGVDLEGEISQFFDAITARARGLSIPSDRTPTEATRVSMLPANKRNRVTHGTKHMRYPYA